MAWSICNIDDEIVPDSKVHVANMGPIWGQQDPGGPHVGPMNLATLLFNPYANTYFLQQSTGLI